MNIGMTELLDLHTGWAFLALSVWNAAFTANALQPLRRPFGVSIVSFFAGWLTCELALHHIGWQLVATLVLVWYGALDQTPGLLALGVSVASWAGLARLHSRGQRSEEAAFAALTEGLPAALSGPEGRRPVTMKHIARPFFMPHPKVERVRGVVYNEVGGRALRADVYCRRDRPANAPVLVFAHGGAWIIGFKEYQALPMLYRMASQGWVCISIDYRLSPGATFPDHIVDMKRAIVWAKEHAAEYGGDPSFIAASGNSAGAHLASLAALSWDDPSFQPGFEDADTRVQACVSLYGVYDWTNRNGIWPGAGLQHFLERVVVKKKMREHPELFASGSPIDRVRPDAPPFLIVHGDKDTLVPVGEGRTFSAALRAVSEAPVVYIEVPDAQHAFEIFRSVRGHHTVRAVHSFLRAVHRKVAPADESSAAA